MCSSISVMSLSLICTNAEGGVGGDLANTPAHRTNVCVGTWFEMERFFKAFRQSVRVFNGTLNAIFFIFLYFI